MRILSWAAMGWVMWVGAAAYGQAAPPQPPFTSMPPQAGQPPHPQMEDSPDAAISNRTREQQAIARNTERQKKLAEDTQKLLTLATELKQEVDKTNKDILSVDVIKKADEIEKLAKSVKDKMKGSGS